MLFLNPRFQKIKAKQLSLKPIAYFCDLKSGVPKEPLSVPSQPSKSPSQTPFGSVPSQPNKSPISNCKQKAWPNKSPLREKPDDWSFGMQTLQTALLFTLLAAAIYASWVFLGFIGPVGVWSHWVYGPVSNWFGLDSGSYKFMLVCAFHIGVLFETWVFAALWGWCLPTQHGAAKPVVAMPVVRYYVKLCTGLTLVLASAIPLVVVLNTDTTVAMVTYKQTALLSLCWFAIAIGFVSVFFSWQSKHFNPSCLLVLQITLIGLSDVVAVGGCCYGLVGNSFITLALNSAMAFFALVLACVPVVRSLTEQLIKSNWLHKRAQVLLRLGPDQPSGQVNKLNCFYRQFLGWLMVGKFAAWWAANLLGPMALLELHSVHTTALALVCLTIAVTWSYMGINVLALGLYIARTGQATGLVLPFEPALVFQMVLPSHLAFASASVQAYRSGFHAWLDRRVLPRFTTGTAGWWRAFLIARMTSSAAFWATVINPMGCLAMPLESGLTSQQASQLLTTGGFVAYSPAEEFARFARQLSGTVTIGSIVAVLYNGYVSHECLITTAAHLENAKQLYEHPELKKDPLIANAVRRYQETAHLATNTPLWHTTNKTQSVLDLANQETALCSLICHKTGQPLINASGAVNLNNVLSELEKRSK